MHFVPTQLVLRESRRFYMRLNQPIWLSLLLLVLVYEGGALSSRAPPPRRQPPRPPRPSQRGSPRRRGPPEDYRDPSPENNEFVGQIKKIYDSMFFFGLDIPDVPKSQRKRRPTNRKPGGFSPFFTESEKDAQNLFFDGDEIMKVEATQEDKIRRRMDERTMPPRPAPAPPTPSGMMSVEDQLNRIDDELMALDEELELLEVEIIDMEADESRDGMDDRDLLRAQRRKQSILQIIEDLQIEYITLSSS